MEVDRVSKVKKTPRGPIAEQYQDSGEAPGSLEPSNVELVEEESQEEEAPSEGSEAPSLLAAGERVAGLVDDS